MDTVLSDCESGENLVSSFKRPRLGYERSPGPESYVLVGSSINCLTVMFVHVLRSVHLEMRIDDGEVYWQNIKLPDKICPRNKSFSLLNKTQTTWELGMKEYIHYFGPCACRSLECTLYTKAPRERERCVLVWVDCNAASSDEVAFDDLGQHRCLMEQSHT
jgi:hypothetical protein